MKTLSSLFFTIFLLFFSLVSTEEKQESLKTQEIFNGENIVILSKDKPLSFASTFEKNDIIKIDCKVIQQLEKAVNINGLSFKLIKMPNQLIEELEYKELKKFFTVPANGNYKLEIDFPDKKKLIHIIKPILLLKVNITRTYDASKHERLKSAKRNLTIRNLKIGIKDRKKAKGKYPIIKLLLGKGDEVKFKSSASVKSTMKYEVLEKSEVYAFADKPEPFVAAKRREYSFKFYLEENFKNELKNMLKKRRFNDNTLEKMVNTFIKQGVIPCDDLVIQFTPLPKSKSKGTKPITTPIEEDKTPEINFDNSELVDEARKNREMMNNNMKAQLEISNALIELEKARAEQENKRRKRTIRSMDNLNKTLPPKKDFSKKQRSCWELEDAVDEKTHSLVYWVAAGRNLEEVYQQKEERRLEADKSYESLMQYYEKIGLGLNVTIPEADREYIEYAIVDNENKKLFETGADYMQFNELGTIHTFQEYGRDTTISLLTNDLYVCFCNHNKNIPVDVNFRFQTFGDYE